MILPLTHQQVVAIANTHGDHIPEHARLVLDGGGSWSVIFIMPNENGVMHLYQIYGTDVTKVVDEGVWSAVTPV